MILLEGDDIIQNHTEMQCYSMLWSVSKDLVADSKESGLSEQDAAAIAAMEAAEKAQNLANKAIRR